MEREHDDQSTWPFSRQVMTECICCADSAMIMHVVLESAEVSSCGLRNISRVAVHCI